MIFFQPWSVSVAAVIEVQVVERQEMPRHRVEVLAHAGR